MSFIIRMVFVIYVINFLISTISARQVNFTKSSEPTEEHRCRPGFYCFANGICVDDCPPLGWEVSIPIESNVILHK